MKKKALALLSGGLDSTLAVKMMLDQGVEVVAVNFMSPFCNCTPKSAGCKSQALKVAHDFNIPVRVINKGIEYLKTVVEHPKHGYGRGMNPCIDCRIYMHRKAKQMLEEEGASFIVSGEVLGQRPMSQRRHSIELIERESETAGILLRPLSAMHFEPTLAEQEGVVDREKLLAIEGRCRKEQIKLADEIGVTDYPCPAGGCMLTEVVFAGRLKDLFEHNPDYDLHDARMLRHGRHLRLSPTLKVIVGRDEAENTILERRSWPNETTLVPEDFMGPTALTRDEVTDADILKIGSIILRYSKAKSGTVTVSRGEETRSVFIPAAIEDAELEPLHIQPISHKPKAADAFHDSSPHS